MDAIDSKQISPKKNFSFTLELRDCFGKYLNVKDLNMTNKY